MKDSKSRRLVEAFSCDMIASLSILPEYDIKEVAYAIDDILNEDPWTKLEKESPPVAGRYLIVLKDKVYPNPKSISISDYHINTSSPRLWDTMWDAEYSGRYEVTHWMELPSLPEVLCPACIDGYSYDTVSAYMSNSLPKPCDNCKGTGILNG